MNQGAPKNIAGPPEEAPESEATGLPGLRTWGAVYGMVTAVFVVVVVLLVLLSRMFS